ncbi:MAG: hypothetical protein RLZ51_1499, partial [Pseudomonadota bacterium]
MNTAFELDGREVEALPGETLLDCARRHGIAVPNLCAGQGLRPDGNCRSCVVEIAGERTLAASCCRQPAAGMKVSTASDRARASQRMVIELLLADAPAQAQRPDSEVLRWASHLGVESSRFAQPTREAFAPDLTHPAMAVQLDACIQCNRCVRACREVQGNDVIGMALRGAETR